MDFKKPLILVNFKSYASGTGAKAVAMAKRCEAVNSGLHGKGQIAVAVQAADIYRVAKAVRIPVFAQHIDLIDYGKNTGWLLPEDAKENGAAGTLINHSEHRIAPNVIAQLVRRAKSLGLVSIACAKDSKETAVLSMLKPDYVAVEPPELIGNPNISVCTAKPSLIRDSVANAKTRLLVGAGVKSAEDVRIALRLGAKGVLLASDVMNAKNPKAALQELAQGIKVTLT